MCLQMLKQDLELNDQQCLICRKTKPNQNGYQVKCEDRGYTCIRTDSKKWRPFIAGGRSLNQKGERVVIVLIKD